MRISQRNNRYRALSWTLDYVRIEVIRTQVTACLTFLYESEKHDKFRTPKNVPNEVSNLFYICQQVGKPLNI